MFPRIDKGPVEYEVQIGHAWNAEQKKPCIRFLFHTTEEFHHFRYVISIEHAVMDAGITFSLRGLKTKGMGMPAAGRAEAVVDLFDLFGTYAVSIAKPGDITNSFGLRVTRDVVKLVTKVSEANPFLEVTIV